MRDRLFRSVFRYWQESNYCWYRLEIAEEKRVEEEDSSLCAVQ